MRHHERIAHVRQGTDYKAPLRAINEHIEGLVECGLIVKCADRTQLAPETRALDAIGTQVLRELQQRAEMIQALVARCNTLEDEMQSIRKEAMEHRDLRVLENGGDGVMPEQRRKLVQDMPSVAG